MKLPRELVVPPQKEPIRLDRFLVQYLKKTSRTFWRKNLEKLMTVNGSKPKKSLLLQGGERLCFLSEKISVDETPEADSSLKVQVVLKDPSFLVVEKPAGIAVHPLSSDEKGTLIQGVIAQYPEVMEVGTSKREFGLIHRLDNETSGLVLIARTPEAFQFLREEFRRRRVEKEYLALVVGEIAGASGRTPLQWEKIDSPIAHHPKNKKKMKVVTLPSPPTPLPKGEGGRRSKEERKERGRQAITFFSVEKRLKGFTLLRVRIPTGVRHQIRVHLHHLGHPIVGDVLYGGEKTRLSGFDRIFLHATRLSFRHPRTFKKIECHSGLPPDLKKCLNQDFFLKTASGVFSHSD
jgi:23S rRNA pseudouridine1911/1915/1917 synthase